MPVPATGAAPQAQSIGLGPQGRATAVVLNAVDGVFLLQTSADGASWEHLTPTVPPLGAATARAVLACNWAGQRKMFLRETFATYEPWNNRVPRTTSTPTARASRPHRSSPSRSGCTGRWCRSTIALRRSAPATRWR